MSKIPDDDLFSDTTMSFGEHLEELRGSLFRAIVGLLVGFVIGLAGASHVVNWIQTPLRDALERYYQKKAVAELDEMYGDKVPPEVSEFMIREQLALEEIYVEREQVERLATALSEGPAEDASESGSFRIATEELPAPDRNMVKARIWRPLGTKITTLSAQEAFMIWLKAAFVAGLIISSPYIFWQLWNFVAAGLYPHEKRYMYIYLPFSLVLFWSGAAMAFFVVFRYVLDFLLSFNRAVQIEAEPRISEWMSFVLFLPLGFGIAFQLPLVMLFLHRITIFSVEAYIQKWRIAILVIFVIAMLLTPADPVSMLLMAAPLSALYFLGIALCKWMPRGRNPFTEAYEP